MAMATDDERRRTSPTAFGHRLKRLRASEGLTQEELAERAGVSARLVSDLERGAIQRPRRDTVRMLADGLRLTGAERDGFTATARGWTEGDTPGGPPLGRTGLPLPPTSLVGRSRELAAATSLLLQPETRLLTLTGPGGVGKTRLALEVALQVIDAFPYAVRFIDLAPMKASALVLPSIAQALGVRESGERTLREGLISSLQGQRLLVVLDNVEHLTAAAPALGDLLAACDGLTILATSRQPLHLRAEHEYSVMPLVLPDLERHPSADELADVPAVDLFVRRAEAARRSFALTTENAPILAEIAVRLDGLPLAIELAAARVKVLPLAVLLARLEHRLPLLTGGAQDLPTRQQTLRATLDWSHDLLDSCEQALFRRLAVFSGGFTLDAAEAVCAQGPGNTPPVPDPRSPARQFLRPRRYHLSRREEPAARAPPRRRRPVWDARDCTRVLLGAAGRSQRSQVVRDRHAAWCMALAERAEPELVGPDQQHWSDLLDVELDNLRAAHAWSIEQRSAAMALRLASAVQRFWTTRGLLDEGRRWLQQALGIDVAVPEAMRAKALVVAALLAYYQGDYEQAVLLGEEGLE